MSTSGGAAHGVPVRHSRITPTGRGVSSTGRSGSVQPADPDGHRPGDLPWTPVVPPDPHHIGTEVTEQVRPPRLLRPADRRPRTDVTEESLRIQVTVDTQFRGLQFLEREVKVR